MPTDQMCPDCHHPWKSHEGSYSDAKCGYRISGLSCPCRNTDPEVDAENRLIAATWNRFLGRKP